jgi:Survival motor neuron (SMN) interacting protein 1 (SIP1)
MQKEKFTEMQQTIAKLRSDPDLSKRLSTTSELNTDSESSSISFCKAHEPVLSTILCLNQGEVEELIETLSTHLHEQISTAEFIEHTTEFDWLTKWIYATLACLRTPLDPEVHNCLRMIAKSCIQVTSQLKSIAGSSGDSFLPWNLVVVVIAICFHQFDLLTL